MKLRLLLLASVLSIAASAAAEPPIGSRLGNRLTPGRPVDEATSVRQAHALATCLVNKRAPQVRRLLGQTDKNGYTTAYKMLIAGEIDCYSLFLEETTPFIEARSLQVPTDIFRGLLAEELIERNLTSYAALAPLPRQLTYSRVWYGATDRNVSVDEMATCVSEVAPADALALIKAPPQSDAEGAAFAAVVPHMGACLRAGVKLTGNRQSLRAALADALFQRVANPVPQPATSPPSGPSAPKYLKQ